MYLKDSVKVVTDKSDFRMRPCLDRLMDNIFFNIKHKKELSKVINVNIKKGFVWF